MNETLAALNRMAQMRLMYYEVTTSSVYLVFEPIYAIEIIGAVPLESSRRVLRITAAGEGQRVEVREEPYAEWASLSRRVWNHTTDKYDTFGAKATDSKSKGRAE